MKCVLDDRGIQYIDVMSRGNGQDADPYRSSRFVRLTWHTYGCSNGLWHLCRAPIPGFIESDPEGYAGFSSVCSPQCAKLIDRLDLTEAIDCFTRFSSDYVGSGLTKYSQPKSRERKGLPNPYVFVPLQVPGDSVLTLSTLTPYQLCNLIIEKTAGSPYSVVVKQHPRDPNSLKTGLLSESSQIEQFAGFSTLRRNIEEGKCFLKNLSIHDLISGAEAVITVNSGVGLESLLHRKPVFIWGKSLYNYAAVTLPNIIDLSIDELLKSYQFDQSRTARLFYYILTQTFIPLGNRMGAEHVVRSVLSNHRL
ncbi:hypothetical protein K8T06_13515 [bacterium]|nr:hypothetical protein [bacterium]